MDSRDLTDEQRQRIQQAIRRQQRYWDALLERMREQGFPADDELRGDAQAARDKLNAAWMTLHYLGCKGKVGG